MPRYRAKAQVKANLNLWLNNLFLSDGFYTNVTNNELDVYGRNISSLITTSSESYPDYCVWQSPFKNWVWETGIVPQSGSLTPIIPSGVRVNGTFYPQFSGSPGYSATYAHSFDFPNGRVIFASPISSSATVTAEFAYKTITVDFTSSFENEQREFYIETSFKDNPQQTGVATYPEENSIVLPLVSIDIDRTSYEPYELGNASNLIEIEGVFSIWTRDSHMLDQIEDLIGEQEHSVIQAVDFNTAPYPLTYNGDRNGNFGAYSSMADIHGQYFWRRIYLDEIDITKINPLQNIERSEISFLARVYPNF